jgi:flagellin-like hook-associated protein FlgL
MSLTIQQTNALYKLYPNVTHTVGDVAYDADGNEVTYDLEAVTAEAQAAVEAQAAAKQSALNKLMALGLTEEEALALGVK